MRHFIHSVRYLVVLLLICSQADAQVIDRMMAVVSNHIITLSDVTRERLLREVLGDKGSRDDKAILNDLIDAQLIEDEIAQSGNVAVAEEDVDREFSRISDYHGLPASVLREAVRRRLRADQFFDIRFRQLIRVNDDEIRQYYQTVFVPEAQQRGVSPVPPVGEVTDSIQKNLVEEKTSNAVDSWLANTRQRSDIEIFP